MSERKMPKLPKWPFFAGDALLVGLAYWIVQHYPHPLPPWPLFFLIACVAAGAWIAVTPFQTEFRAQMKFAEADSLTSVVEQIGHVHHLADQIGFATAQWQVVQEHAGRTVEQARGIADKMTAEAKAFAEFMQKANDAEKGHLRLEVEKLRRVEGEWLQVLVHVLDHVYALYQAGLRSGQSALIGQLSSFQNACRETSRRVGLIPFEARPDDPFNEQAHQLVDPQAKPPDGARVGDTLATGYTFQGQCLRRALVTLAETSAPQPSGEAQLPLEAS